MEKFLTVNSDKCTGCRLCELVCSVMHEGVSNPAKSRIQVVKWEDEGRYIPMICQQCEDAPCQSVCPVGAISRDKEFGFLKVDYDVCIGCRLCVSICPFGAMNYNKTTRKVFKCDLCGGDPQCVRFCEANAIEFVTADVVSSLKKREGATRQSAASKQSLVIWEHV
ncbi:MAG: electron transporter [Syntrophobacterales bacterium CG_4_8_14_3_um_filter_58_8]|nr:MAG: electron transporter [Syntrophaceae bacterium CG2_30_58_14]PIV05341.1 MAG: electron transporter [Syntrophobacterales bacterium CG03_land_8_20_14_0_80_58_14]PJC73212.1 MAG: electron transporter [Syntrophobacterales bacterium CG_4_8_14_3_um_filter_58_8]